MWYQYHHWTDQRFGLNRPSTIDACDWAPGGNVLCCDVKKPLSAQQSVKFEKTLERQTGKMKRDVERNCTEGNSGHYQVNWSAKKHKPPKGHLSEDRMQGLFKKIQKENERKQKEEILKETVRK